MTTTTFSLPVRTADPIPFETPCDYEEPSVPAEPAAAARAEEAIAAVQSMSRRIDDLARELNCLGYFDDDDRPRAA